MKETGIIRKIDEVGRLVIPIEIRKKLDIDFFDEVEIFVDKDSVVIKKYEENCLFCGKNKNLVFYKEKTICNKCLKEIKNI